MLAVTLLEFVVGGIRLFWFCIVFYRSPGLWLIMWMDPVLHLILRSGLLVRFPRDVGWCTPCEIGPAGIWDGEWIALAAALVTADDVETWPYSVEILVEWVAFLSSLHWPAARADLGVGGVSSVVMLKLHEVWAGERLVLEKAVHRKRRRGRPISVSAVPFGPGTEYLAFLEVHRGPFQRTVCFAWWYW